MEEMQKVESRILTPIDELVGKALALSPFLSKCSTAMLLDRSVPLQ
jgi:hypothetical protein